jgi:hypothetical protein
MRRQMLINMLGQLVGRRMKKRRQVLEDEAREKEAEAMNGTQHVRNTKGPPNEDA